MPKTENVKSGHIFLFSDKKYFQIKLSDILYVEAAGNYSKVVLNDNSLLVREKISGMLGKLSKEDFLQVHKSFIISKEHINRVEGNRVIIANYTIPIGKLYKNKAIYIRIS